MVMFGMNGKTASEETKCNGEFKTNPQTFSPEENILTMTPRPFLNNPSSTSGSPTSTSPSSTITSFSSICSATSLTNEMNTSFDGSNAEAHPKATLLCRQKSHPFQDRNLILCNPVKIGRAVAKSKPANENAIFDCKVLSRNHALLWYENGKFLLQDTRSSNGTFVNNQRLSPANEESSHQEICSGDLLQFGVDVIENSKKVTHGCIMATIKLYLPDGSEAKASRFEDTHSGLFHISGSISGHNLAIVSTQNLYQLAQYVKEATHREQVLANKLNTLQKIVSSSQSASQEGWKCLAEEDRLLSRVECLESKLESVLNSTSCKSDETVTCLRNELLKLYDEKENYEAAAKEAIHKALEEKLEAFSKIHELEASLKTSEEECIHLKEVCENVEKELGSLSEKYDTQVKEAEEISSKMKESEEKISVITENSKQDKSKLDTKISEFKEKETELQNLTEELKNKNEALQRQIDSLKLQLEVIHQDKLVNSDNVDEKDATKEQLENVKQQLIKKENLIVDLKMKISNLEKAETAAVDSDNTISIVNGELKSSDNSALDNEDNETSQLRSEISSLKVECDLLRESLQFAACSLLIVKELLEDTREAKKLLEEKLLKLQLDFELLNTAKLKLESDTKIYQEKLNQTNSDINDRSNDLTALKCELENVKEELEQTKFENNTFSVRFSTCQTELVNHKGEISNLKALLDKEKQVRNDLCANVETLRKDLKNQTEIKQSSMKCKNTGTLTESSLMLQKDEEIDNNCLQIRNQINHEFEKTIIQVGAHEPNESTSQEHLVSTEVNYEVTNKLQNASNVLESRQREFQLEDELQNIREEYELISYQNKIASACAIVPLIMLFIAILLAFYPSVSSVTGTTET